MPVDDHDLITSLYAHYGHLLEHGLVAEFSALFTPDAVLTRPDGTTSTGQEELETMAQAVRDRAGRLLHFASEITVDVAGNTARGAAHVSAITVSPDGDVSLVMMGQYFDTFARLDGHWLFASRAITPLPPPALR